MKKITVQLFNFVFINVISYYWYITDKLHSNVVCKGKTIEIECPTNQVLAIHTARYGYSRPGVVECPSERAYDIGTCQFERFCFKRLNDWTLKYNI